MTAARIASETKSHIARDRVSRIGSETRSIMADQASIHSNQPDAPIEDEGEPEEEGTQADIVDEVVINDENEEQPEEVQEPEEPPNEAEKVIIQS